MHSVAMSFALGRAACRLSANTVFFGSDRLGCLHLYRLDQDVPAFMLQAVSKIAISLYAHDLGQVEWYRGMHHFGSLSTVHELLGSGSKVSCPSAAALGGPFMEIPTWFELKKERQSVSTPDVINVTQKHLIWGKLCLDVVTFLLLGIGLLRRMLDQVRTGRHSRRAKKLVWVGNARRQARLPIQAHNFVWRVVFFTYLLTVDASGLSGASGHQIDEVPLRSARNATSADSGVDLLHRATWAQVVAQRQPITVGDVPVQIFAAQDRVSFVASADALVEPDMTWAVSRLQEAGVRFDNHF